MNISFNFPPKFEIPAQKLPLYIPPHPLELREGAAAVDECLSGGGARVAGEHLEGGRLARAVHPQQPEALPLPHAEGQPACKWFR